ncbi:MAG TPA: hypothetical protein VI316_05800 [Candidatus Dormibacteraeota bacterium]
MAFADGSATPPLLETLRRLGEDTATLVEATVEQAQQEFGDIVEVMRATVTTAAAEAAPDVAATRAFAAKLGYACIGLAAMLEEEIARRLSDLPAAGAVRNAHASSQRSGRGV